SRAQLDSIHIFIFVLIFVHCSIIFSRGFSHLSIILNWCSKTIVVLYRFWELDIASEYKQRSVFMLLGHFFLISEAWSLEEAQAYMEIMIILIWLHVDLSYWNVNVNFQMRAGKDGIQEKEWFDAWLLSSLYLLRPAFFCLSAIGTNNILYHLLF
ncbi:hypothetical protein ACJX0J_027839, partial [Zea mays]